MDGITYGEQLPVPQRRGPAFGESAPMPAVEDEKEAGPLDRRTETMLACAIVTPVIAAYSAVAYGAYLVLSRLL